MTEPQKSTSKSATQRSAGPPNIVVCSDGTWNRGGALTPTNVWRTFLLVDPENQIKFHDDGVGSEGIRPIQIIGGAFGYGISKNLRELIAFLIQSYQPGSKIFLFGFSRGAFTVRILADIICQYGIPNKKVLPKSEDIQFAAAEMLARYKDEKARLRVLGEQIEAQESNVPGFHEKYSCYLTNCPPDGQPRAESDHQSQPLDANAQLDSAQLHSEPKHLIHFLGCWDTVGALGVPFDWLKKAATQFFPLRFRNNVPNKKIKTICHALSLDDERRSFHPLCFDDKGQAGQTIHQTWFPGNHSHVGGGYRRDQMAIVPLQWMLAHAERADLAIHGSQLQDLLSTKFTHGQLPSSRAGMNFFYGYHPRRIDRFQTIAPWSIHASAFQRLGSQIQAYLPTAMVVKESTTIPIRIDEGNVPLEYDLEGIRPHIPADLDASKLTEYMSQMKGVNEQNICLGRVLWMACLAFVLSLLLFGYLTGKTSGKTIPSESVPSADHPRAFFLNFIYGVEELAINAARMALPDFLFGRILDGFQNWAGALSIWFAIGVALLYLCQRNRRIVEQQALKAWKLTKVFAFKDPIENRKMKDFDCFASPQNFFSATYVVLLRQPVDSILRLLAKGLAPIGKYYRSINDALAFWLKKTLDYPWVTRAIKFAFFLALAAYAVGTLGHNWNYNRNVRVGTESAVQLQIGQSLSQPDNFHSSDIAYSTGVWVSKGETYQVEVRPIGPVGAQGTVDDATGTTDGPNTAESKLAERFGWTDRTIPASPNGFQDESDQDNLIFAPRRSKRHVMFRLLGTIEPGGRKFIDIGTGCRFTATADGLLVLFVNDVRGFYGNNTGQAAITENESRLLPRRHQQTNPSTTNWPNGNSIFFKILNCFSKILFLTNSNSLSSFIETSPFFDTDNL